MYLGYNIHNSPLSDQFIDLQHGYSLLEGQEGKDMSQLSVVELVTHLLFHIQNLLSGH